MPHVVAAPDKFRGTATASEVAAAVGRAAVAAGWTCDEAPVADGGEGLLEVVGGSTRRSRVRGPLGEAVEAEWLMLSPGRRGGVDRPTALIEMAQAAGLSLVGGPEWNDAMRASTAGVGDLIAAAVAARAGRVIIGLGGSATTDGGLGCLESLRPHARLRGVELVVACDVTTTFLEAASEFAPQKGASAAQVALLGRRLERLAQLYRDEYGVDVTGLVGSGAAGGLAGGLAALGAALVPGFELVADLIDLESRMALADLVVTGEGFLDDHSFRGKAVGGVVEMAASADLPVLVVAGESFGAHPVPSVSLVERFGRERAMGDPLACVEEVVAAHLAGTLSW
ncbi:MAG: glycerate kinase [Acidimicrobiales bacterium]